MTVLRGMTWDHPRGVLPLQAAAGRFQEQNPEVKICWDARSLHDFEAYPLEKLAEKYDVLMIDHPHLGSAVAQDILVPLNDWLPASFLEDQKINSVGLSFESYTWQGKQWALAVDAAAQVSTYRKDLIQLYNLTVPRTWEEVKQLIRELPPGLKIALPLSPVHAYSSFVTLSAQLSGSDFWKGGTDLAPEIGAAALSLLEELTPCLHESSFFSDPISILNHMARHDDIAYIPLVYGYSNYARDGFAPKTLLFTDIPSNTGSPQGSMIGGVGIAVSNRCRNLRPAMEFVQLVASESFQKTVYVTNGGQPGHRSAWMDTDVNRLTNDFFLNTLSTLEKGYLRPRFDGYIRFQEQAGELIREWLMERNSTPHQLVSDLNKIRARCENENCGIGG